VHRLDPPQGHEAGDITDKQSSRADNITRMDLDVCLMNTLMPIGMLIASIQLCHIAPIVETGNEANMKQENIVYLDRVACIASANMVYHQSQPISERDEDDAGAALLMSAFLEMYDHWRSVKPGAEPPSERVYIAADACVLMRNELHKVERHKWPEEAESLLQMMTAFMFLFKHMYVTQN
jgi:hypothetical protein